MEKIKIIVSPKCSVSLGEHVFIAEKFVRTADYIISQNISAELIEPKLPSRADLLLAHTSQWVSKVVDCKLSLSEQELLETPFNKDISIGHQLACSGTILACDFAVENGIGLHSGGGGHHAFSNHGEGFCLLNDIAIGVKAAFKKHKITKAMIIDLDVHQGNGTAEIFGREPKVFTFSVHQGDIYPEKKEKSSLDIEVRSGLEDNEYLNILYSYLPRILDDNKPELVVYVAGADTYKDDLLGGLKLTMKGLQKRDEYVYNECFSRKIPVAVVLGGGYAHHPEDTVKIHAQTLISCLLMRQKYWVR